MIEIAINKSEIILCNNKKGEPITCGNCGTQMVKNPHCSGDYYPTQNGIQLMTYCPQCGVMKPIIEYNEEYMSKNQRNKRMQQIIRDYNLIGSKINQIWKSQLRHISNKYEFIDQLARVTHLDYEKLLPYVT